MLDQRFVSLVPMTALAGIIIAQLHSTAPGSSGPSQPGPSIATESKPSLAAASPAQATSVALETPPSVKPLISEPAKPAAVPPDGPHMDEFDLADYAYSETEPPTPPAKIVLASLDGIPEGTPLEEIDRASKAFHLDPNAMKAVAKIESDFNPKERTGSYVGLFQLSPYEFDKYGVGKITDPRDNAIAAAYKFATNAKLFEIETHKTATTDDLYLIHQQGWQGAAEHVAHPDRVAWQNMCATDEGRQKGDAWCKRAIWENTLPSVRKNVGSVDKLLSQDFVQMWQARVEHFLTSFAGGIVSKAVSAEAPAKERHKVERSHKKEEPKTEAAHHHHHAKA